MKCYISSVLCEVRLWRSVEDDEAVVADAGGALELGEHGRFIDSPGFVLWRPLSDDARRSRRQRRVRSAIIRRLRTVSLRHRHKTVHY